MAPSSSSSATTSVQVALRIRPPTNQDAHSIPARFQRSVIQALSPTSVSIEVNPMSTAGPGSPATVSANPSGSGAKKQNFSFDQVHGTPTTQYEMFTSTAQPLISRFVEGFNCTILAYGQTSSGKTYTMTGIDLDADPSDPSNGLGIIPRAVSTIFTRANQLREERGGAWSYSIKGSFIEIYNEDLLDLLAFDDLGGRREVQIREDKDGTIIWGGLREVNVRTSNEVMSLIRKGTAIRRTNETDMNAQSSRSHAIFSLTLTQKKYSGSSPPPRSSSPHPPGGRSPSRLARPGSMYAGGPASARVGSPTFGRPGTPNSFTAAMGRGGLRPASALGHAGERSSGGSHDEEPGEWVTIVSKFHFVDLAGSERLKRTAAAGERIKEGISINSGLLALGNVISALGDPSRSKTTTHIPYRDSKLTRLLQDSLGGNAHTLMIACVSPAEYNAGETINTLKYANRARNIKNRAVVNEKEEGWEDMEWLQGTVTRLRKELKLIKEGGVAVSSAPVNGTESASKRVLTQMTELQNNYEDLRAKFVDRTEELTRLRRDLGEKHRNSSTGTMSGTARYEEIVGPVIEEYEKTISAIEAELSLNRAALRHTNELVEEKEDEIVQLNERHAATELYIEELKGRLGKVTEREASTEAYVHDLEEKMRTYDESSVTSSESLHDLKREITRFKDAESYSSKYIADLESRLSRSDESILELQQTVERLEKESDRRRDEVESLQARLDALRKDGESWRSDLEERERKVKELEKKMEDWEQKRKEAGEARVRLGTVVGEVASARRSLELDLANQGGVDGVTPSTTPTDSDLGEPIPPTTRPSTPPPPDLQNQLLALQQTHTATLADLSSVTAKYRDALREISDLAAQIQEAKLSSVTESPAESPIPEKALDVPPFRRRMTGGKPGDLQYNSAGRRLFFREAASAESLHLRSLSQSQSLSQELSSAHLRKTSFSSHGSSHSPSNSYSPARPNLSISLPPSQLPITPGTPERSVASLEKEIMRLQEVLKEREAEISVLESSLKESRDEHQAVSSNELTPVKVNGKGVSLEHPLTPSTMHKFDDLRKSMELHNFHLNGDHHDVSSDVDRNDSSVSDGDESLERLNELMLSMAQKESQHREVVDELNTQLTQVRRQFDELTTLSRDQALNMSTEIEALRGKHDQDLATLKSVQEREAQLVKQLEEVEIEHATSIQNLRVEHEQTLQLKSAEVDDLLSRIKQEHAESISTLRTELVAASEALQDARREHETAFGKLKTEHEAELRQQAKEVESVLSHTKEEHDSIVVKLMNEHAEALRQKDAENTTCLQTTEEEYYNALTKLRTDHAEALKKHAAENNATIERLKEEHAGAMRMGEIAREGRVSESQSAAALAIKELQDEHNAAIARKETSLEEDKQILASNHARQLQEQEQDYMLQINRLRSEHEIAISKLKEEWNMEAEQFRLAIETREQEHSIAVKARIELEETIQTVRQQQAEVLQEVELSHQEETSRIKAAHQTALNERVATLEKQHTNLLDQHGRETATLQSQHMAEVEKLTGELSTLVTQHDRDLQAVHTKGEQLVKDEQTRQAQVIEELEKKHALAIQVLQQTYRITLEELEALKANTDAATRTLSDEQARAATELDELSRKHEEELEVLRQEQKSLVQKFEDDAMHATNAYEELTAVNLRLTQSLDNATQLHANEIAELRKGQGIIVQELESHKSAVSDFEAIQESTRRAHEIALNQRVGDIAGLEKQLSTANHERDELEAENAKLYAELEKTRNEQSKLIQEASKRASLVEELEHHRSILAEMQENLQKAKDEKDVLQSEKNRSDSLIRELQAQIARGSPPPNARSPDRSFSRATGLPPMKLPPPTPPPSVPPPPAPRPAGIQHTNSDAGLSVSSHTSSAISSSSKESQPDSPSTSIGHPSLPMQVSQSDPKFTVRLEQQSKQLEEQEAMIKTLNKQLTHCETDLQTHMDLVSSLETSLGESEKNLRKARMHATELARERDTLNSTIETLRNELNEAKREVVNVRRSIVEEKQSLEQRLDEERKAKERVRQQLDSRMEELQRRKSKFACL